MDTIREEILKHKSQAYEVLNVLEEYGAKKAELVDNIPFYDFENNLALEFINKCLMNLYNLIQNNPLVIKYVESAIEPINDIV